MGRRVKQGQPGVGATLTLDHVTITTDAGGDGGEGGDGQPGGAGGIGGSPGDNNGPGDFACNGGPGGTGGRGGSGSGGIGGHSVGLAFTGKAPVQRTVNITKAAAGRAANRSRHPSTAAGPALLVMSRVGWRVQPALPRAVARL